MAGLPPYSGRTATCVKCAASVMTPKTKYFSASPWGEVGRLPDGGHPGHEFLLRICSVCGFEWLELCADA